jgi:hypothetical protein
MLNLLEENFDNYTQQPAASIKTNREMLYYPVDLNTYA